MKKYRFLKDYTVDAAGGEKYREGQIKEFNESSGMHFLSRGVVEIVESMPEKIDIVEEKTNGFQKKK